MHGTKGFWVESAQWHVVSEEKRREKSSLNKLVIFCIIVRQQQERLPKCQDCNGEYRHENLHVLQNFYKHGDEMSGLPEDSEEVQEF